jgi:hypothetical protein
MKQLFLTMILVLVPTLALGGPPAAGTYLSQDIGGLMLNGRFSESYVGGSPGEIGNTIYAQSFDGSTLGTQWNLSCVSIAASPTLISDSRDVSGTGSVIYITQYDEGTFFLDSSGPWADGSESYTGIVLTFENTSTHQYVLGDLVAVTSNVTIYGMFDGYSDCMQFVLSNSATLGSSPDPKPADYPDFMDDFCGSGTQIGAWGVVPTITLTIQGCSVDNDATSFGTLKTRW